MTIQHFLENQPTGAHITVERSDGWPVHGEYTGKENFKGEMIIHVGRAGLFVAKITKIIVYVKVIEYELA